MGGVQLLYTKWVTHSFSMVGCKYSNTCNFSLSTANHLIFLMNVPDPLFVYEHTALDKLAAGLVEPCGCGQTKWVATSRK